MISDTRCPFKKVLAFGIGLMLTVPLTLEMTLKKDEILEIYQSILDI